MSDIKVRIYGEFQDQGFKRASKATSGLERSFKKLGLTVASVFATQKIVAFGKASLKAFSDDEAAARRLTQTLTNLNLGFEDPRIRAYISSLEQTTGVLDDKLRPAMQSLLMTTGSVTKSQELLGLAIDVAAGSGVDLETVAQDLSAAYVGNNKGLRKYYLGLTQTELKSASFAEIQTKLNKQFSGQNAAFLETYAGKVSMLDVAFANAKETIGKGLVNAFILLAGDNGIGAATSAMDRFSTKTSNAIYGAATLIDKLNKKFGKFGGRTLGETIYASVGGGFIDALAIIGQKELIKPKPQFNRSMSVAGATDFYTKIERDRKKSEQDAAKRNKALAAMQKKAELDRIKREKESQQLKRAGTIFDMENIQIVAALQGRINEEQRLRLIALLAINNDIADAADKTTSAILALQAPMLNTLGIQIKASDNASTVVAKIVDAQTKIFLLNAGISNIPKAKNPFEDWDAVMKNIIKNLDTIADKITKMPSASTSATATSTTSISTPSGTTTTSSIAAPTGLGAVARGEYPRTAEVMAAVIASNYAPDLVTAALGMGAVSRGEYTANIPTPYSAGMGAFGRGEYGAPTVIVNVAGSVTAEADLAETIRNSLYDFQKSGGLINIETVAI